MSADYKSTLNLPQTDFPMRADLPRREPDILARWDKLDLYGQLRQRRRDGTKYVLHDGPPYANGSIHMGTALNKVLKDFIVRYKSMRGFDAPYVPGWDCHGLPIEHRVAKDLGERRRELGSVKIRELCREFALKYVDVQRQEFQRLGVMGDWQNPYLTLTGDYEARILEALAAIVENGLMYKGVKPVLWCSRCETALAEAEVEYRDHTSPSIYVRFPLVSESAPGLPADLRDRAAVLIWTTTPWTLPANVAIALHPEYFYCWLDTSRGVFLVVEPLAADVAKVCDLGEYRVAGRARGREFEHLVCRHPFVDREVPLVLANYVTLDTGTGCVHTAPGHGQEDYVTGLQYNLPMISPVDDQGRFTEEFPYAQGQHVEKANGPILDLLREKEALLGCEELAHSYPHCWRCKNPVIFRATAQWFISIEAQDLREKSLKAVADVDWIPRWGEERITNMIAQRPEWCVSRQRSWGVPIPALYCLKCGATSLDAAVIRHLAGLVREANTDVWYDESRNVVPEGFTCPECGGSEFRREQDILDVWFDSGVTHFAVLETRNDLAWPADLYLEGNDQYRGWYQSSLLTAVAIRERAPYRAVITHGWMLDSEGHAMHKSAGNVIPPQDIISRYGADVLRLWVASEDFRDDLVLSQSILAQQAEAYRRIRNTCRFLLGNLYDFDQSLEVPYESLEEIDRWALHGLNELVRDVTNALDRFEFHRAHRLIHRFCVQDMSALYLDILKDRLYCDATDSQGRRSAQTALHRVVHTLVRLMAPVLPFTADEVWEQLANEGSVHLADWPEVVASELDPELAERWKVLLAVRDEVMSALEVARANKDIGHPLEAKVELTLFARASEAAKVLRGYEKDLADLFIVSSVELVDGPGSDDHTAGLPYYGVGVSVAVAEKCPRCWQRRPLGTDARWPDVCQRCAEVLESQKS